MNYPYNYINNIPYNLTHFNCILYNINIENTNKYYLEIRITLIFIRLNIRFKQKL